MRHAALHGLLGALALWWPNPGCTKTDPFADPVRVAEQTAKHVPAVPTTARASLEVEHGGCALIVASNDDSIECIYTPDAPLRLWVTHPSPHDVRLEIDGRPWLTTTDQRPEETGRGHRGRISGDDARRLVVNTPDGHPWTLRLRALAHLTPSERHLLDQLAAHQRAIEGRLYEGDVTGVPEAMHTIDELLEQGLLSTAVDLAQAMSYHLTHRATRPDLAREVLEHVRTSAERYPEGAASMAIYGSHALERDGRLVEAAAAYRRGARYAVRMDDVGLQLDALSNYSMVLAELGYFEAAVYWGKRAVVHAREQGRLVDRLAVMTMVARVSLRLRQMGKAHDDPEPLLHEIFDLASTAKPENADQIKVDAARLGLATLAVLDGESGTALRHLDALAEGELIREDQLAMRDLRLRAHLQLGADDDELRQRLTGLEAFAATGGSHREQWLATVRRGEILERLGDLDAARAAYERSETLLDRMIPRALLGAQGEIAPARKREGSERLVELLLRQGHAEQALCVSRQAQARVGQLARVFSRLDPESRQVLRPKVEHYRTLQRAYEERLDRTSTRAVQEHARARKEAERLREELAGLALEILSFDSGTYGRPRCDELSPRLPGELLLGLYPHQKGVLVLAQDDAGTTHRLLASAESLLHLDDPRWLGNVLLKPLEAQLARASRVRVLASGKAAALDVHALPWRGRPLVEQVPVVYGLDLPRPSRPADPVPGRGALVLADPRARGTNDEQEKVIDTLLKAEWPTTSAASNQLTAHQLREALASVEHFHYAGHAYYDLGGHAVRAAPPDRSDAGLPTRLWPPYPGGAAAEPSYIPLGRSGHLDVPDVLMMESVPRSAVLMGCATGVHDERMAYGGFSLATAFLGAGATVVIASTREVDGSNASLVGRGLYADFDAHSIREPGRWLMHAVRWAREHGLPEHAIRNYRVLVP
ncbi:MAG: CHAT domain-containing protein [Myxococcota bacterium]